MVDFSSCQVSLYRRVTGCPLRHSNSSGGGSAVKSEGPRCQFLKPPSDDLDWWTSSIASLFATNFLLQVVWPQVFSTLWLDHEDAKNPFMKNWWKHGEDPPGRPLSTQAHAWRVDRTQMDCWLIMVSIWILSTSKSKCWWCEWFHLISILDCWMSHC